MKEKAIMYYLYHSGFAVKTKEHFLIFDYYNDKPANGIRDLQNGVVSAKDLNKYDNVCVFVSHSHYDHFNPVIFEWTEVNPKIRYFLSSDVPVHGNKPNYRVMKPYQEVKDKDLKVKTYGSTDEGVSFHVELDGLNIFHAGDLNCWYWYYESTPQELEEDYQKFVTEIEKIKGEKIDIAFFPVDPRLKEYYYMGGEYFIKLLEPKLFIPMHFGDQYSITRDFAHRVEGLPSKTVIISKRGQKISI